MSAAQREAQLLVSSEGSAQCPGRHITHLGPLLHGAARCLKMSAATQALPYCFMDTCTPTRHALWHPAFGNSTKPFSSAASTWQERGGTKEKWQVWGVTQVKLETLPEKGKCLESISLTFETSKGDSSKTSKVLPGYSGRFQALGEQQSAREQHGASAQARKGGELITARKCDELFLCLSS